MPTPFLSIIIPTLNEELFLPKLLSDLSAQTLKNFEIIIVDGHSEDQTFTIAETAAAENSLVSILTAPKKGASAQRNFGAKHASAQTLLFLDADTRLPPFFLEMLQDQLAHQPVDAFTTFAIPDTDSLADKLVTSTANTLIMGSAFFKKPFAFGACLGCSRKSFEEVGGFNEDISFQEDAELLQRIVKAGNIFTIFSEPAYVFCMRRYQEDGTLNVILKTLPYTLLSIANGKFFPKISGYDMEKRGATNTKLPTL